MIEVTLLKGSTHTFQRDNGELFKFERNRPRPMRDDDPLLEKIQAINAHISKKFKIDSGLEPIGLPKNWSFLSTAGLRKLAEDLGIPDLGDKTIFPTRKEVIKAIERVIEDGLAYEGKTEESVYDVQAEQEKVNIKLARAEAKIKELEALMEKKSKAYEKALADLIDEVKKRSSPAKPSASGKKK